MGDHTERISSPAQDPESEFRQSNKAEHEDERGFLIVSPERSRILIIRHFCALYNRLQNSSMGECFVAFWSETITWVIPDRLIRTALETSIA